MQYWLTCECDISADIDGQEGKQIVIADEEALAVYVNWEAPEIGRYIRKIFSAHDNKSVIVNEIRDGVYAWWVIREPDNPAAINFTIKLGSTTFRTELEDSEENTMGERLSRKIGQITPPFADRHIDKTNITHPKAAAPLWEGTPTP
jgi:hypothetical protein